MSNSEGSNQQVYCPRSAARYWAKKEGNDERGPDLREVPGLWKPVGKGRWGRLGEAGGGWGRLEHPRRSVFRDVEWQEAAQGLGCKPFLAERRLHVEVRITAFMEHVCCMFILLAKQLLGGSQDPHLGIRLLPSTSSMQLCLGRTWPQEGARLYRLGKARGAGGHLCSYREVLIPARERLPTCGLLGR